jgi:pyruvate, water dikinase
MGAPQIGEGIAIRWFGEPGCDAVVAAGGKGAGLSRMAAAELAVPPGFVVCAGVFARLLDAHDARRRIVDALADLDVDSPAALAGVSERIQALIHDLPLPSEIEAAIAGAYGRLGDGEEVPVAVRSSAIAEDSGTASFAGQQATYLNVAGAAAVAAAVRRCWASFFGPHALFYRRQKGSLDDLAMAVVVQRMIVPEKSGVLFTVDPVGRRRDRMVIEATWGFGEAVVSGLVVPDNYQIERDPAGTTGRVVRVFCPPKPIALVRDPDRGGLIQVAVPPVRVKARVLGDEEIGELVALGLRVEAFFGAPQDVEWGIEDGRIYLLQSRPITTV